MSMTMEALSCLSRGIPLDPLPGPRARHPDLPHAPPFHLVLSPDERKLAVSNALRYFPPHLHQVLGPEFAQELDTFGHIYMYRFTPTNLDMRAHPLDAYPARTREGAAIMAMVMNNLDPRVAQFPQELVTYGTNGQVFSNWAQFWLLMRYLSLVEHDQTISLYSGHAMGMFPSLASAPRLVITNGLMVPNHSSPVEYARLFALGVTMYGQMTAGSFCYIGPQGIVHGTVLTLLNAGRRYLGTTGHLAGRVFLTSGLGGMSGAQAKAAVICGCIGVIAEVSQAVIKKRKDQGWVDMVMDDPVNLVQQVLLFRQQKKAVSIAYHGNIVTLWQAFRDHCEVTGVNLVDLASDQTSCHNAYNGGYYPHTVSVDEANHLMRNDGTRFQQLVRQSLVKHVQLINEMSDRGTKFWDYGNAFLLEASRAGAEVGARKTAAGLTFKYPSYVQDIMGDIFSLGFGPFRWVCMSQSAADLTATDEIAVRVMQMILDNGGRQLPDAVQAQYADNIRWIHSCRQHDLVVGSKARILYSDQVGRVLIALALNKGIHEGRITAPVVLSRDHHDVSGTDSPFRETSNLTDGSAVTADMSVQNFAGLTARGATWVSLHNGGGVGWGEVMNGGFGLLIDGSSESESRIKCLLNFGVANGVARRSWAGHERAMQTIRRSMQSDPKLVVTVPFPVDQSADLLS